MHLWLHLSCVCVALVGALSNAQKWTNNSSNGGYDAGLEGTLHGEVNIAIEGTP